MNTDNTIDVKAVVTPNCAIDRRNQISSYKTLQKPETKKKKKNQAIYCLSESNWKPNRDSDAELECSRQSF
jgi:hypothetical protein